MKNLKYSRQRESIKSCLMNRTDHPTAEALYLSIREEFPNISLGTVYRNLNLLAELGEIQRFSCGDGSEHFDYRTELHYHFICRCCGSIYDLPLALVRETSELLSAPVDEVIDTHTIFFYGECVKCRNRSGAFSAADKTPS
ncbi:MAG: transcriptional repressor [Lachnospiraceae bacterium]|nr:transcriptional repressor [Lachnospiraceae bacterium]